MINVTMQFSSVSEMLAALCPYHNIGTGLPAQTIGQTVAAVTENGPSTQEATVSEEAAQAEAQPQEGAASKPKRTRKKADQADQAEPAVPGDTAGAAENTPAGGGANNTGSSGQSSPSSSTDDSTLPPGDTAVQNAGAGGQSAPPASDVIYTDDDIASALAEYNAANGLAAAKELLTKVGASRRSEISKDRYAEFMALAKAGIPA